MRRVKMIATACVVAVMALGMSASAQDFNPLEKTYLTFSAPVELPGMTLPAGTYVFRLADTPGRNVVQVLSQDERQVHGQFLFMQHRRPDITSETVVTFRETREGATPAIQYWYYPNDPIGKEFIYPREQATQIAARTGSNVLSEDGVVTPSGTVVPREETATADAQAEAQQTADARPAAEQPQPADQQQAAADTNAAQATAGAAEARAETAVGTSGQADAARQPESQTASAELPRTASPLALIGLLGLMSLAGAAGVRYFRN